MFTCQNHQRIEYTQIRVGNQRVSQNGVNRIVARKHVFKAFSVRMTELYKFQIFYQGQSTVYFLGIFNIIPNKYI